MTRLKQAGIITALGLLAVAIIGPFEGYRPYAYRDVVGVWTACYGETAGIKPGMKFTRAQCDSMFIDSLEKHERALRRCLSDPDAVPMKTYVAMLSLAYNIGEGGFCKSSVVRRWNAGNRYGACDAFLMWNKAGGRVIQGLVTRRKSERKLCIEGLSEPVTLPNPEDVAAKDRPWLRVGSAGFWVEHLQRALGMTNADGHFGHHTARWVREFQKENGLLDDGVVGGDTWAALVAKEAADALSNQ